MNNTNFVLIVDDDPVILEMTCEILKNRYTVSCVKSGFDAIELLQSDYMPDIILLDIEMPNLNGFETLKKIRDMEDFQDVPVIFLTGVTQTNYELKGLSYGAVDYITKPFVKEILLMRLKVHLENGKRLRHLSIIEKDKSKNRINEKKFELFRDDLNDTEMNIARLIALGYTNHEISETLFYSYSYVKKLVGIVYEKKHVTKRSDLKKMLL
jgi:Response regulators consisting of a CheY-like receiver domain and a winged-helix DNA-binding domain